MNIENNFKSHFTFFINKIKNNENFTFARYADGEKLILENSVVSNDTQAFKVDKWSFNKNQLFFEDLLSTCHHKEENYYHAISCKCCDPNGLIFYRKLFNNHNITFSNLFINGNYDDFIKFVNNLNREVVLIANKNCLFAEYPFNVLEKFPIENDCVNWYEKNKDNILKEIKLVSNRYKNTLFFISAGPLSEILIHNLYINNPDNCYVDVGSSLDRYTHKKITRPYQLDGNRYKNKICEL